MMLIFEENRSSRLVASLSMNVLLLLLMAVAGVLFTPAFWPVIYTVSVTVGLLLVWLNSRGSAVSSRTGLARFSSLLGKLTALSLLFALGCWTQHGLNHPLTHAVNGITAVFMTLLWINEKYSPQPLVIHALRVQPQIIAKSWASALYMAGAGTALFLLPIFIRDQQLAGGMSGIITLLPLAVATLAGYWLSGKGVGTEKLLNAGLLSCAIGVGILYLSMDHHFGWFALLPAQLLLGVGHGVVTRTMAQPVTGQLSPELQTAANRLMVGMHHVGGAVAAGIIVILLDVYPGIEGLSHAFGLLTAFAVGAVLVEVVAGSPRR